MLTVPHSCGYAKGSSCTDLRVEPTYSLHIHRIASSYFEVQQHNEEIPVPYTPYPTTPYNCSEELILEIWLYIEKEFLNIVRDIIKDIMFDDCYTKVEANS